MAEIEWDDSQLRRILSRMEGMRDFRKPLTQCGILVTASADRNFQAGGRPSWRPLKPITLLLRKHGGNKPLLDSDRLRQSVSSAAKGGGGSVWRLESASLEVGSNLAYAAIQQFGGVISSVKGLWAPMPARAAVAIGLHNRPLVGTFETKGRKVLKQQFVFLGRSVTIPARPYLDVNERDVEKMQRVFGEWIAEKIVGGSE